MSVSSNSKTLTHSLSSFTKERILGAALQTAFELKLPVAIWRLPNHTEINLIVGFSKAQSTAKIDLEELPEGFAFAPFNIDEKPAQFIAADFSLSFDFDEVVENQTHDEAATDSTRDSFKNLFKEQLSQESLIPAYHKSSSIAELTNNDYEELVDQGIQAIHEGLFEKIVPARSKTISLKEGFNPIDLLLDLIAEYPRAFVSLVSIPNEGTWMGATPEVLIEKSEHSFKTVALAGTQPFDIDKKLIDTAWTQKEIEEQAMVSRYIINCFKKIRLREYTEIGPRTEKAGNLLHLKTTFQVDTQATNFPELATVMLELLHPTSAVAGMPKAEVLPFLKTHENLSREYFSGFLGPVQMSKNTHLFVNLRCMQLRDQEAILYAGAGVTSDSDPKKEFQETEIKFNTLLNVIAKQN
ncbi:chorismate-binding protein [Roseivirga misakiensis]|uniref:Chorismate-utilising enzyme C-terminal domain-containing protein n=1 Tax=Roseivirga misakiensis TaxID=1563681 RepID=A0A1E5T126_9BACT|nr:chorismate-binding protein [Roseivirga misakiensis]OEK05066.1 hypothetical protein BFP71_16745 [Roseivirga misakiensis]